LEIETKKWLLGAFIYQSIFLSSNGSYGVAWTMD
jgi:hypothetical protein